MIQVSEEQDRPEEKGFWEWVLSLLDHAGYEFMSDEEDASVLDQSNPKRVISTSVKEVKLLKWRHPYFLKLFIFLDLTSKMEEEVFGQIGRPAFQRIRAQKASTWPAPSGRPISFYAPVFLGNLCAPEKAALRMDSAEFVLRSFEGYSDD